MVVNGAVVDGSDRTLGGTIDEGGAVSGSNDGDVVRTRARGRGRTGSNDGDAADSRNVAEVLIEAGKHEGVGEGRHPTPSLWQRALGVIGSWGRQQKLVSQLTDTLNCGSGSEQMLGLCRQKTPAVDMVRTRARGRGRTGGVQ